MPVASARVGNNRKWASRNNSDSFLRFSGKRLSRKGITCTLGCETMLWGELFHKWSAVHSRPSRAGSSCNRVQFVPPFSPSPPPSKASLLHPLSDALKPLLAAEPLAGSRQSESCKSSPQQRDSESWQKKLPNPKGKPRRRPWRLRPTQAVLPLSSLPTTVSNSPRIIIDVCLPREIRKVHDRNACFQMRGLYRGRGSKKDIA